MDEGERPPVYVVDTQASRPPIPPRPGRRSKCGGGTQTLLILLVSLSLCGLFIEACFIYSLHQSVSASSPISSKQTGDERVKIPRTDIHPSKPVAHMTGGPNVNHDRFIMAWSAIDPPILYRIAYSDRRLIIEKAGYYYVYSKVYFTDSAFHHSINRTTHRYGDITLLQSRKYSSPSDKSESNSFLGGVFQFDKNDAVYVTVSDTKKIGRHSPQENVFGLYMI